jgi:hypothetical protein
MTSIAEALLVGNRYLDSLLMKLAEHKGDARAIMRL